jgi:acetylglutamate kinase
VFKKNKMTKPTLTLVKIGGNIIDNPVALSAFLNDFSKIEGAKVLVHGGGKSATKLAEQMGLQPQFIDGRRITDAPMLDIAVMTYAGLINKNIVAQLQALQTNAMGLSGADGTMIVSEKRKNENIDFGWVGDVIAVNGELLTTLIEHKITPVFCAITHDGNGQLLNTNADTIASELAITLSHYYQVKLIYCFEKQGVLSDAEDDDSVILNINSEDYQTLKNKGSIHSGMIPKLDNCFYALSNGVEKVCIGLPEIILNQNTVYTTITI